MQACLVVCFEYYPRWPMNIKCNCVQVLYSHQCFCYKALCRKKLGHVAIKETFFCPQTIPAEWFWNVSRSWLYCTSNERVDLGLHTALIQATKTIYIKVHCILTRLRGKRQPTTDSQVCPTAEQFLAMWMGGDGPYTSVFKPAQKRVICSFFNICNF